MRTRSNSTTARQAVYRNTDPDLKEREAVWSHEAREWIADKVKEFATEDEEFTVADFMARMDATPANQLPTGYIRVLDSHLYPRRYQMVRSECEKLHRAGFLGAGTTVNAKGREDVVCYRKAPPAPQFQVELEGASVSGAVKSALEEWVKANAPQLRGLDSVLISRVKSGGTYDAEASAHGPSKRTKAA